MFGKFRRQASDYEWRAVRGIAEYNLKRQRFSGLGRTTEVTAVAEEFCIGKYNPDNDLHLGREYNLLGLSIESTMRLADLSNVEVVQKIREAPRVTLSNLNRDDADLLYCPFARPFDEEVKLNQRAALYGQVPHLKLFAVTCNFAGQVVCHFYNAQTQLLSGWIFNENSFPYDVICCLATCEEQRYLIFCDGGRTPDSALKFVLQYGDDQAKTKNQRTYLCSIPQPPR